MNFADILKFSGHKRAIGMSTQTLSKQTQKSWWTDAGLFISAAVAALSGVYFLFLPNSGYQGGRNTYYGIKVILLRRRAIEACRPQGKYRFYGAPPILWVPMSRQKGHLRPPGASQKRRILCLPKNLLRMLGLGIVDEIQHDVR